MARRPRRANVFHALFYINLFVFLSMLMIGYWVMITSGRASILRGSPQLDIFLNQHDAYPVLRTYISMLPFTILIRLLISYYYIFR